MRKQKPVALYAFTIFIIIFGALYLYTRPGHITMLYDFVNPAEIDMVGASVRVYEGDEVQTQYATDWYQPGEAEYDELMALLDQTTFQRTLKTLTPLPDTRQSPHLQPGMYVLEVFYHNDENGFVLESFYGETTIHFYEHSLGEQFINIENESDWEQTCYDFVMEHGKQQETTAMEPAA